MMFKNKIVGSFEGMEGKTILAVDYLWDDKKANSKDPVERLVYRSNILGDDQRVTNTGGGNTSSKIKMKDPITGDEVDVLWVKGSGGDLRTSKNENFASLYMDKFNDLEPIYDRCINCEAIKKIVATITLDQKPGPMCKDCFILHKK